MNSKQWSEKAKQLIPGGVNSPVRSFKHVGGEPVWFSRAKGASLFDVEEKEYIDFCLSFGPHILGHSHPAVVSALEAQVPLATSFGACHPKEVELAELILQGYQFLDRVRLVNSGTEAVMTAVRLARGFTGRNKIIQFEGCYHGHSDGLLAKAGSGVAFLSESSSKGVPPTVVSDTLMAQYDDYSSVEKFFDHYPKQVAAIVLEPIAANNGIWVPKREQLERICQAARSHGALVIFDEVITGFRMGPSGASGYFNLEPDLVTLGKIIGGGLPLAAIAGRKEIMDCLAPVGEVYQAGTLSGNPLATAAGCAVLNELFTNPPYPQLEFTSTTFAEGLRNILGDQAYVRQIGSLFWIHFGGGHNAFPPTIDQKSAELYGSFFQKALKEGIYFPPSPYEVGFLSVSHTPEVLNGVLEKIEKCWT